MNRSLVFAIFAVALTASFGAVASANTVNISLDLFYGDSGDADLLVDTAARGTWQLTATADERGLAGLATQLTGIAGLSSTNNRPLFRANSAIDLDLGTAGLQQPTFDTFKPSFEGGTKPWDTDTSGDFSTLEMLFGQVPVAAPGPQELTYDIGKLGGSTPNVDELGDSTFLSVAGVSMTDGVLLAFGRFDAGSTVALNPSIAFPAGTGANVFSVAGTATDPPADGTILSAASGTLNLQTRTNIGVAAGDLNLNGIVNAADAGTMFGNWDNGVASIWRWQEGDLNGDLKINAADAGEMFGSWSLPDPGPAAPGTAAADYDPTTGEIVVSIDGVNNWFVESASASLTGVPFSITPIVAGSLASDSDVLIGETGFATATGTDVSLGNVAALGLLPGDLTISWNAGLGQPVQTILVNVIPEPASLALAVFGLCGVLATRRRRVA